MLDLRLLGKKGCKNVARLSGYCSLQQSARVKIPQPVRMKSGRMVGMGYLWAPVDAKIETDNLLYRHMTVLIYCASALDAWYVGASKVLLNVLEPRFSKIHMAGAMITW